MSAYYEKTEEYPRFFDFVYVWSGSGADHFIFFDANYYYYFLLCLESMIFNALLLGKEKYSR